MAGERTASSGNDGEDELSRRWREESRKYASAINAYVARGEKEGWDKIGKDEQPKDTRQPLAEAVLAAVRRANQSGAIDGLRERFPPAHEPFIDLLKANGQSLPVVLLLDDGRILLRIGAPYEPGSVVMIDGLKVEPLPSDVVTVGRSPDRVIFAVAREKNVTLHRGWDGPITATLNWPSGLEGIPKGYEGKPLDGTPIVTQLIPFNSGDRALLVSPDGIFVLAARGARRLLPTEAELREYFDYLKKEAAKDPSSYGLSMEHGAVSPDGKLIAAGHQSSLHYVFDADSLQVVGEIGHLSEYPHYAAFSDDGTLVAFNSCHFYNGVTVGVPTKLLPGLKTEAYELNPNTTELEDSSRVYAAVCRKGEFIIGDAYGYLRAFDGTGAAKWRHFIGSTVGSIDLSRDGRKLLVTTYAGYLCILDLDTGKADPYAIGTSTHRETRRWLFWKDEEKPLVW